MKKTAFALVMIVTAGMGGSVIAQDENLNATLNDSERRLGELVIRTERLQSEREIENLQRIYGYYLDRRLWDQVTALFSDNGTIEIGMRGVYAGKKRIRESLELFGRQGLSYGELADHANLQPVITVAPDNKTAKGRVRAVITNGTYGTSGLWGGGVYENEYVRENGVWKIASLRFYTTFAADYAQGWAKSAFPAPTPSDKIPPDRASNVTYENYPGYFVPPFHYANPATSPPVQYPQARPAARGSGSASERIAALEQAVAQARNGIQLVHDRDDVEILTRAYGYYLDKSLWDQLADLFAEDGSIEIGTRGTYVSRERIRKFLHLAYGTPGPKQGVLSNHMQLQPVIHVAPDGKTAKARVRLLFQTGRYGQGASWGGGVYENEYVKRDGVWQIKKVKAYTTFVANYEGGWARSPRQANAAPSEELPPDIPPGPIVESYPNVYELPFHYENPVTGGS